MNVNELIAKMMIISMEAGMVRKEEKFPHSLCGKRCRDLFYLLSVLEDFNL